MIQSGKSAYFSQQTMDSETFVHPALRRKKRKDAPADAEPAKKAETNSSSAQPLAKRAKINDNSNSTNNQPKKSFPVRSAPA